MATADVDTPCTSMRRSSMTTETQGSELCSSASRREGGRGLQGSAEGGIGIDASSADLEFFFSEEADDAAAESLTFSERLRRTWFRCCGREDSFIDPALSIQAMSRVDPFAYSSHSYNGSKRSFSSFLQCFRSRPVPRVPPFVEGMRMKNGDLVEVFCLPCINVGVSQSAPSFTLSPPVDLCCYEGPPAVQYRGLPHFIGCQKPVVLHHVHLSAVAKRELEQHQQRLHHLQYQQRESPSQRLQEEQHSDGTQQEVNTQEAEKEGVENSEQQEVVEQEAQEEDSQQPQ